VTPVFDAVDIQYQLKKRGKSQADVARALGVKRSAVSQVVHRKCRSQRIETLVSRWIGVPRRVLFPEAA